MSARLNSAKRGKFSEQKKKQQRIFGSKSAATFFFFLPFPSPPHSSFPHYIFFISPTSPLLLTTLLDPDSSRGSSFFDTFLSLLYGMFPCFFFSSFFPPLRSLVPAPLSLSLVANKNFILQLTVRSQPVACDLFIYSRKYG